MGKAKNLKARVKTYFQNTGAIGAKTKLLVAKIRNLSHIVVESELESLLLEANLIKRYAPPFNVRFMDGKAYPFIKITLADRYPAVLQSRKLDHADALFFGPFPNIGDVRRILKWARRIFPYQSVKNHPKRRCLYYHLDLCPCPPLLPKEELTKYKRSMRYLARFLQGKKAIVRKQLKRAMQKAAEHEDFEEAAAIKKQLDTLLLVSLPFRTPQEYIHNPNLALDEAKADLESLQSILTPYFRGETSGRAPKTLSRIECYDISNLAGKEATGSMVVATDGQIDKSQYRRFKIRLKDTPDDIAMHQEVLRRRLKHDPWPLPGLIVIDGGVAQVGIATEVVKDYGLQIPVIGLAKRLEEIVLPQTRFGFELTNRVWKRETVVLRLPRNHRALKLLQRLRDEAHRFALAYHRKLRKKAIFSI